MDGLRRLSTRRAMVVTAALVLSIAGCSGADDPAADRGTTSTSEPTSSTSTVAPPSTDSAPTTEPTTTSTSTTVVATSTSAPPPAPTTAAPRAQVSCSTALADLEEEFGGVRLVRSEVTARPVALHALTTWGTTYGVPPPNGDPDELVAVCLLEGDNFPRVPMHGPPPQPGQEREPKYFTLAKMAVFEDGTLVGIGFGQSENYASMLQMPSEL